MAAAGAAAMGSNLHENKRMHKGATAKRARREEVESYLAERNKELTKEVDHLFAKYDTNNNGSLCREETRELIYELTADDGERLSDEVFDRVLLHCSIPGNFREVNKYKLPELLGAVRAYKTQGAAVTRLIRKHDGDGTGQLEPRELVLALREISPKGCRVRGSDVQWLLQQCDLDRDGDLDAAELVPALAIWREMMTKLHQETHGSAEDDELADAMEEEILMGLLDQSKRTECGGLDYHIW